MWLRNGGEKGRMEEENPRISQFLYLQVPSPKLLLYFRFGQLYPNLAGTSSTFLLQAKHDPAKPLNPCTPRNDATRTLKISTEEKS